MSQPAVIDRVYPGVTDAEDVYPSRNGQQARLIDRLDPVVYATAGTAPPIDNFYIDQYRQNGFVVLDNVFNAREIEALRREAARLNVDETVRASGETITELDSGDIRSAFRVHEISPVFAELVSDRRLTDVARYILNDEVYIHQSRVNYKPEFRGREFYWHSDFETWHVEDGMPRMRALSMSITLTENSPHNGPLMLIPGSHNRYAVCPGKTPAKHYLASLKRQVYGVPADECLETMTRDGGIVTAAGRLGSVIIFDCNVMHGSNSNITPYPRTNVFFVYNAMSNAVVEPFCGQPPRPEYICSRENIYPVQRKEVTEP